MPVLCAFVPAYKVAVARLDDARLHDRPLIVADRLERGHAIALDAAAYTLGARLGMTLVQAAACAREATIVLDDPLRNGALWERVLDALDAASPLIEDAAEGTAFLEMRGIAGSETRWLESVREALASDADLARLPVHVALAPNKFVARTAALVRDGHVVHAGDERAFVAPLSLAVLELDRTTLERLDLFGVANLRTLAALPHGPFVRRFGPQAARWHALAGGIDETPIVPRTRHVTIDHSTYGEGTAEREDQLLFALRTLVARVAEDVAYAGKRCGILELELECEDGERVPLATTLAQPSAQTSTMFDLLRARLEGVVLRSPVTGMRLAAERLEEGGSELSLFANRDPDPEIVGIALARLEAALGPEAAVRASVVAGNRYESRVAYEPFTAAGVARSTRAVLAVCDTAAQTVTATLAYRVVAPRAVDVRVTAGRPAHVGSRAVLEVAGPWRVDEAWWAEALDTGGRPVQHDAYDVLLEDGALCRIVLDRGRWYVSGSYD
jgi:protein ImuB